MILLMSNKKRSQASLSNDKPKTSQVLEYINYFNTNTIKIDNNVIDRNTRYRYNKL